MSYFNVRIWIRFGYFHVLFKLKMATTLISSILQSEKRKINTWLSTRTEITR